MIGWSVVQSVELCFNRSLVQVVGVINRLVFESVGFSIGWFFNWLLFRSLFFVGWLVG